MKDKVYLWYSGATDKTGKALTEALGISGGVEKPTGKEIVIGWGTKIQKDVDLTAKTIINHPNLIRQNRNKLEALRAMQNTKVAVASFVSAAEVMASISAANGKVRLPLVGRSAFHQGGQDFWLCITKNHVATAIKDGADYFQNFIDIGDEYRIHIMDDKIIYAQKKTIRENMAEAFIEQTIENVKNAADRKGTKLDEATLKLAAEQLSKKQQNHADTIIRSNTRGYKFVSVKEDKINAALLTEAKNALKALGLQFGAVDCCIDTDRKAWIIEVNTGPGLDGTSFDVYKEKLKRLLDGILNPPKVQKTLVINTKATLQKSHAAAVSEKSHGKKEQLLNKAKLMQEMLEVANEVELESLDGIFSKMFGGSN